MGNVRLASQKNPEISFFIEIFFIRGLPCLKGANRVEKFPLQANLAEFHRPLMFSAPVDSWNQFLIAFSMRKTFFNELFFAANNSSNFAASNDRRRMQMQFLMEIFFRARQLIGFQTQGEAWNNFNRFWNANRINNESSTFRHTFRRVRGNPEKKIQYPSNGKSFFRRKYVCQSRTRNIFHFTMNGRREKATLKLQGTAWILMSRCPGDLRKDFTLDW